MAKGVLDGIRVCALAQAWSLPYMTTLMAFLGAEVISIEGRPRPNLMRFLIPFPEGVPGGVNTSGFFNLAYTSNLSITVDLHKPKGVELVKSIARVSDIVTENFRPGTVEKFGLGYDDLKEIRPDLIMIRSSAMGHNGPEMLFGGFGQMHLCLSGLAHLTGYPDGPPELLNTPWGDPIAAMHAGAALIAALHHRQKTGEGQYIEMSQLESTACFVAEAYLDYAINGRVGGREGNRDRAMAPHGCYRCIGDDRWVTIAVATDEEWQAFCNAIDSPAWTQDERFADGYLRWQNQDELDRLITAWTELHADLEVAETLQQAGVAAFPTYNAQDMMEDEHVLSRGFIVEIDHPEPSVGRRICPGLPFILPATPPTNFFHSPLLGEHNDYVLGELLKLSDREIAQLREEEVI